MRIVEAVHDDVQYRGHRAFATDLQFQRAITSLRGHNDGSLAGALSLAIDVNNLWEWARCFNNAQALNGNGGAPDIDSHCFFTPAVVFLSLPSVFSYRYPFVTSSLLSPLSFPPRLERYRLPFSLAAQAPLVQ